MNLKRTGSLAAYGELKRRVRLAIASGRRRAEDAVEREKVRTSWEVGKLIHQHILLNKKRADYGKQVLKRLSADIALSETELYYMLEFARTYPIFRLTGKLPWGHYQALLRINNAEQRNALAEQASRENWNQKKIRREVKKLKAKDPKAVTAPLNEPLIPIKGQLDTYRIVIARVGPWKGKPAIDLGFSNYLHYPSLKSGRFKEGDIVSIAGTTPRLLKSATPANLFTYRAYPFKVTDGDTLWVLVDLGFGFVTQQHLRLRGIDAPEITTRDGQRTKRFVERELKDASSVTITSSKSDKYDRYLADVFYTSASGEKFLNNELLKAGLAVRVTE